MIIIYTEKPSMALSLGSYLKKYYPNEKLITICDMYFSNIHFKYPKNMKWKDYPQIHPTQFNIRDLSHWRCLEVPNKENIEGKDLIPYNLTCEEIRSSKVIYGGDTGTNTYLFYIFMNEINNIDILQQPIEFMNLLALDKNSIEKSYQERFDNFQYYKQIVHAGMTKRYFEYNYNINSLAIFGKTLERININPMNANKLSKYVIQLLYFLNENPSMTEGQILESMHNWKGTGKYSTYGMLGSLAARVQMIENLLDLGLIVNNKKYYVVSSLGQEFLSFLHKDCEDSDLPFRLEIWQAQKFEDVKSKVDKYLETYFSKQKRKLEKM